MEPTTSICFCKRFCRDPTLLDALLAVGDANVESVHPPHASQSWQKSFVHRKLSGGLVYQNFHGGAIVDCAIIVEHNKVGESEVLGQVDVSGVLHEGAFVFPGDTAVRRETGPYRASVNSGLVRKLFAKGGTSWRANSMRLNTPGNNKNNNNNSQVDFDCKMNS